MSLDSIPEFCEQLLCMPSRSRKVDLLLVSQGGDSIAAWRIISLLRERFDEVDVLVPFVAQSAATILSFGADHIVMHPFACLGPIDPQITIPGDGMHHLPRSFSVEDVRSYLEFVENDLKMGVVDAQSSSGAVNNLGSSVLDHLTVELTPTQIGLVKKSMKLSEGLAEKLLSLHMADKEKVSSIVKSFNSMTHHGYTIGRREAKDSGLPVEYPSPRLENLMWAVWKDLESDMKSNVPFEPMASLMSDPIRKSNLYECIGTGRPYDFSFSEMQNIALVESVCFSSHFDVQNNIMASGNGINISFNVVSSALGWVRSPGE